jgi:hypothetical protein
VAELDAISELGKLLELAGARPALVRSRVARSTLYDPDYHIAVIACAFATHASSDGDRARVLAPWLKMIQFVAARPHLVQDLLTWVEARRSPDLASWAQMPRGYIGDRTHDATVQYLVAQGIFSREKDYILAGERIADLNAIASQISENGLFERERTAIDRLKAIKATRAMLGGQ